MEVKLYAEKGTYKDKEGKDQQFTNFYLKCGNQMIPIEPKYFKKRDGASDKGFIVRKGILDSFAEPLPSKEQ